MGVTPCGFHLVWTCVEESYVLYRWKKKPSAWSTVWTEAALCSGLELQRHQTNALLCSGRTYELCWTTTTKALMDKIGKARGTVIIVSRLALLIGVSILLALAVNPKKDSENTPVKGGTVADLGKANTLQLPLPEFYSQVLLTGQQNKAF